MPKLSLAGHPLHPMLIVAPAALIPFGFILDAMHRSRPDPAYSNAAYYSLTGGLVGGLAAAGAGLMDYLSIEPGQAVKQTANVHAMLNGGVLAVTAANLLMRKNQPDHAGGSLALSALATAGVVVAGWFGAHMVYEHGLRVKGAQALEHEPELAVPGSEKIEQVLHAAQEKAPAGGPRLG